MTMRQARLGLLIAAVTAATALRVDTYVERARVRLVETLAPPPSGTLEIPPGYLVSGLRSVRPEGDGCTVIRIVSGGCAYCRAEEPAWDALARALDRKGCRAMGVDTSAGLAMQPDQYGIGAGEQLALVTMDWVKQYHPEITPTTVVISGRKRVVWYHVGELRQGDVKSAATALRRSRSGGLL